MSRAFTVLQNLTTKSHFEKFLLGVDLGSYQTRISFPDAPHPLTVPSCIVLHKESGEVLSVGKEAKEIQGRSSSEVEVFNPIKAGIPTNAELTGIFLDHCLLMLSKKTALSIPFIRPELFFLVSPQITEVQYRALEKSVRFTKATHASYLLQPMIGWLGIQNDQNYTGIDLLIDCGYESTTFSLLQFEKVRHYYQIAFGGKDLNLDIQKFFRHHHHMEVGISSCERVKQECAKVLRLEKTLVSQEINKNREKKKEKVFEEFMTIVRGRDVLTGIPKTLKLSAEELRPLFESFADQIVEEFVLVIEELGAELVDDLIGRGIHMVGGMSVFTILVQKIEQTFGAIVHTTHEPDEIYHRGFVKYFKLNSSDKQKYVFRPEWV